MHHCGDDVRGPALHAGTSLLRKRALARSDDRIRARSTCASAARLIVCCPLLSAVPRPCQRPIGCLMNVMHRRDGEFTGELAQSFVRCPIVPGASSRNKQHSWIERAGKTRIGHGRLKGHRRCYRTRARGKWCGRCAHFSTFSRSGAGGGRFDQEPRPPSCGDQGRHRRSRHVPCKPGGTACHWHNTDGRRRLADLGQATVRPSRRGAA